jgi:hypothetical protein
MKTVVAQRLNNQKAEKLWTQAYSIGQVVLPFQHSKEEAIKLRNFLRNFRSLHKRFPMRNPALLELMNCCKLTLEKDGSVVLSRKHLSAKTVGTSMLLKSSVVIDAMEPMTKADKVLKIFSKESKKTCTAE